MKILEVRDGFVKFEADKGTCLSSFIRINGIEKSYIAQVIQLRHSDENPVAYAKILFLYDGTLKSYDRTLPSKESEIKEFTSEILNNSVNAINPVLAGKTVGKDINIVIDGSSFDKKMLISINDREENNILTKNLAKQFNNLHKNVVIIDTFGIINAKSDRAGVDFKLPLDTDSLAFMYQDCLNDATSDSKSLIVEIFRELAEYSKTVPFVPFDALKSIVDNMVDTQHVFKLLVLKNKLAKFEKAGYFAKNKDEIDKLDSILNSKCAVIDISKLDSAFQNRYLAYIYSKLSKKENTQVFLELSNVVSKKNLKNILSNDEVSTTFITHSRFKYLNDIKNFFDNFVITPSAENNQIFNIYSTFLKLMPEKTYLITGEALNYIPVISVLKEIDEVAPSIEIPEEDAEEEIIQNADVSEAEEPISDAELFIAEEEPENEQPAYTDEIITSIEEKSRAVISEIPKDLTPPEIMFDDDEAEDEIQENSGTVYEEIVQDDYPQEEPAEIVEEPEILENSIIEPGVIEEYKEEINEPDLEIMEDSPEEASEEEPKTDETLIAGDDKLDSFEEQEEEPVIHEISDEIDAVENRLDEPVSAGDLEENAELVLKSIEEFNYSEENNGDIEQISIDDAEMDLVEESDLSLNNEEESSLILDTEELEEEEQIQDLSEAPDALPLLNDDSDFDEIVELNPDEVDENDIIVDMNDGFDDSDTILEEELDRQIVEDVDKVFTTRKEDNLSDSDLDFIDELNSGTGDELEENPGDEGLIEVPPVLEENKKNGDEDEIIETRNTSTPIVPVYDADIPQEDLVMSDPIQQGDTVTHAKYGSGVVEKMIKYGNKTLYSINFDNVGRRLLDPTLTEIKKFS